MPTDFFDDLDGFPRLETERLTLREITPEDAPWFLSHFSIPEIACGQGHPAPGVGARCGGRRRPAPLPAARTGALR